MTHYRILLKSLGCAFAALTLTMAARATVNQTFISATGNDTNPCTSKLPCLTINHALTVTTPGGEIVVATSGSYEPATIGQGVSINAAGGVDASISVTTAGENAVIVNTTANVSINGLTLRGHSTGNDGILATQVGVLHLNNMQIQNFTANGIEFKSAGGEMNMYNTNLANNGNDGLLLDATGAKAWVEGCSFDGNTNAGVDSGSGKVSIADSNAHGNGVAYLASSGTVTLYNTRAIFNTTALQVGATGHMRFANSLLSDNGTNYDIATGGVLQGSDPGSTMFATGSKTNKGRLSAPINLQ